MYVNVALAIAANGLKYWLVFLDEESNEVQLFHHVVCNTLKRCRCLRLGDTLMRSSASKACFINIGHCRQISKERMLDLRRIIKCSFYISLLLFNHFADGIYIIHTQQPVFHLEWFHGRQKTPNRGFFISFSVMV